MCRGYNSGNRCIHGYRHIFRHADGERNPARGREKKELKDQLLFWGKKSPRLCISKMQIKWSLFYGKLKNLDWPLQRDIPEILRMHMVQNWLRERKRESKKVILMSEILARPVLRRNTWWNLTTSRLYQQGRVEFGEKYASTTRRQLLFFSCGGARDTEDRIFVLDSGASMHNSEQRRFELRYNGYFEKVQNSISDLPRSGTVQKKVSTSFCSWFRSVRNSAVTRCNASGSIAS